MNSLILPQTLFKWHTFLPNSYFFKTIGGFPGGRNGKESACQCRRWGFNSWVGKIRMCPKESDMIEHAHVTNPINLIYWKLLAQSLWAAAVWHAVPWACCADRILTDLLLASFILEALLLWTLCFMLSLLNPLLWLKTTWTSAYLRVSSFSTHFSDWLAVWRILIVQILTQNSFPGLSSQNSGYQLTPSHPEFRKFYSVTSWPTPKEN